MIIEGKNPVKEALKSGQTINKLMALNKLYDAESNEIITLAKEKGVFVTFSTKEVLDKASVSGKHQGFVAEVTDFEYSSVDDIIESAKSKGEPLFMVILDGIEDPHNFGAIVRSCECAGVHGIVIGKHRACAVNDTVAKTSVGALSNMKIARVTNINQEILSLKKQGIWVYGAEADGESIYRTNLKGELAVVIGGEGDGVSELTKKNCDGIISLPLRGKINSLNASVACGIVLFEALRQRL
ncbi:MAG: 23S rRNA (guanosine(2251)-2'-O)-methyltransferase RlmB [Clostridia bacterium]